METLVIWYHHLEKGKDMIPTYHIHHNTPEGRMPFTLFVFGPYSAFSGPEWDVEMWKGHIQNDQRIGNGYVMTISDLSRDSHIVMDCWGAMDDHFQNVGV